MKKFYWIGFTRWNTYKFISTKNGYWFAKRIYRKGYIWTPFLKITFHKYKKHK